MQHSGVFLIHKTRYGRSSPLCARSNFQRAFLLLLGGIPVLREILFVDIMEKADFLLELRKEASRMNI